MSKNTYLHFVFNLFLGSCGFSITKMTSGNNIETEYLELNKKNEWPVLYQVFQLLIALFILTFFRYIHLYTYISINVYVACMFIITSFQFQEQLTKESLFEIMSNHRQRKSQSILK